MEKVLVIPRMILNPENLFKAVKIHLRVWQRPLIYPQPE